jgi:hypothetical protein
MGWIFFTIAGRDPFNMTRTVFHIWRVKPSERWQAVVEVCTACHARHERHARCIYRELRAQ